MNQRTPAPRKNRFEVFPDKAGGWRFRLVAKNGEIVAASESYTSPSNTRRAIHRLQAIAPTAGLYMTVPPAMALDPNPEDTAAAARHAQAAALERLTDTDPETLTALADLADAGMPAWQIRALIEVLAAGALEEGQ